MGAVLEMSAAARRLKAGAWGALLTLLGACAGGDGADGGAVGPGGAGRPGPLQPVLSGVEAFYVGDAPRLAPPDPGLFTPEAVAAQPGAFRLMQVNALGLVEPGRLIQANGPEHTFRLRSGPTAAFDEGILVATRGFGDDLMTMGSRGVLSVLRAGGGEIERAMETLDAQDQVRTERFACTITPAGSEEVDLGLRRATLSRLDETCRSPALVFQNIYWLDAAGTVTASRQYVSTSVAYLRANQL